MKLDRPVDVEVPLIYTGKPAGVVTGGIIRQVYPHHPRALPAGSHPDEARDRHHAPRDGRARLDAGPEARRTGVTVRLPAEQTLIAIVAPEKERAEDIGGGSRRRAAGALRLPVRPRQRGWQGREGRSPPRRRRRRQLPRRTPRRSSVVRSACADSTAREERRASARRGRQGARFCDVPHRWPRKSREEIRGEPPQRRLHGGRRAAREVSGAAWKEKFSGRSRGASSTVRARRS